jgi:hypothetical protein
MGREVTNNFDEKVKAAGAAELSDDELLDIDPAGFVDPEEFGIRHRNP